MDQHAVRFTPLFERCAVPAERAVFSRGDIKRRHIFSACILDIVSKSSVIVALFCAVLTVPARGWGQATSGGSADNLLAQLSTAFSNGKVVQKIQLSGTATWQPDDAPDTGTVTLSATNDGSSQMQLELASAGLRTEAQTGTGLSAACQWSGSDGIAHTVSSNNCWKPSLWFMPAFSLQPALLPGYLGIADLGTGSVGSSEDTYRHLQSQLVFSLPNAMMSDITQQSTTDLGLDPTTLLPAVLAYAVRPDNGAAMPVAIEIRYSSYQAVSGVQIPFHIQRYVNGSLQLDVLVSSAQVN